MRPRGKEILQLLLWGSAAGVVNGLLGAGGGVLLLLGLRHTLARRRIDARRIYATTTAAMLPLCAASAYRYYRLGALTAPPSLSLLLPALLGGALGAYLMRHLSARTLNRIFGGVALLSGILMAVL